VSVPVAALAVQVLYPFPFVPVNGTFFLHLRCELAPTMASCPVIEVHCALHRGVQVAEHESLQGPLFAGLPPMHGGMQLPMQDPMQLDTQASGMASA